MADDELDTDNTYKQHMIPTDMLSLVTHPGVCSAHLYFLKHLRRWAFYWQVTNANAMHSIEAYQSMRLVVHKPRSCYKPATRSYRLKTLIFSKMFLNISLFPVCTKLSGIASHVIAVSQCSKSVLLCFALSTYCSVYFMHCVPKAGSYFLQSLMRVGDWLIR